MDQRRSQERDALGRYQTDEELKRISQNERCRRSPTVMGLLETIHQDREQHDYAQKMLNARIRELTDQLRWFEETYDTRARAPLLARRRSKGKACPHCAMDGASHIGRYWLCFDCGKTWEQETDGNKPYAADRFELRSDGDVCGDGAGDLAGREAAGQEE